MAFWIAEAFFRRAYDLKDLVHRIASNDRTRPRRHLLSKHYRARFLPLCLRRLEPAAKHHEPIAERELEHSHYY